MFLLLSVQMMQHSLVYSWPGIGLFANLAGMVSRYPFTLGIALPQTQGLGNLTVQVPLTPMEFAVNENANHSQ